MFSLSPKKTVKAVICKNKATSCRRKENGAYEVLEGREIRFLTVSCMTWRVEFLEEEVKWAWRPEAAKNYSIFYWLYGEFSP